MKINNVWSGFQKTCHQNAPHKQLKMKRIENMQKSVPPLNVPFKLLQIILLYTYRHIIYIYIKSYIVLDKNSCYNR